MKLAADERDVGQDILETGRETRDDFFLGIIVV